MRVCIVCLCAIVTVAGSVFACAQVGSADGGDWKERFNKEFPKALSRLEEHYSHVHGTGVETVTVKTKKQPTISRKRFEFQVDGDSIKVSAEKVGQPETKTVRVAGPRYTFERSKTLTADLRWRPAHARRTPGVRLIRRVESVPLEVSQRAVCGKGTHFYIPLGFARCENRRSGSGRQRRQGDRRSQIYDSSQGGVERLADERRDDRGCTE